MTDFFQLYYRDDQKEKLFPFSIPYKTEGLTIFFENYWISELVKASKADKIGVTSWKLAQKMRIRVGGGAPLTPEAINSDFQILSLTKNSKKHTMIAHLYQWHPKSKEAMELLWQKLGFKLPLEAKNPIYQNSFVATREIYRDYIENFLSPAMKLITEDQELNWLMIQPSGYGRLSRGADVKSVKEKLGLSDYPLCPFVLERCFCLFAQVKGYQITYL